MDDMLRILHPEKRAECNDIFERIFTGETVGEFETVFIAKDGSEVHLRGTSNGSHQGKSQRTRGIFKNITAARETEELQRLSAQLFKNTKEALLITSPRRVIISLNAAFSELTGYSEEDLIGKDAKDFFSFESEEGDLFPQLVKALENGTHWQGELWAYKKTGAQFPISVSISAVVSRYGEVSRYICLASDISEQKKDRHDLQKMAWYDPLTKLPNRRYFYELLENLITEGIEKDKSFALFFLDLDGFKEINDQCGHLKGDQLLEAVARRLKGSLREVDTVARLGGDEFGVLLEKENDTKKVLAIAQKLAEKISAPYNLDNQKVEISASIGISFFPQHKTFDSLLIAADHAMYNAKKTEGVQIKFAKED
ncbi:MAG: diguanylate cyclase [Anaerolineae bacterium]|nr:diguanylate cyclase [Anaerolineae bacterium]